MRRGEGGARRHAALDQREPRVFSTRAIAAGSRGDAPAAGTARRDLANVEEVINDELAGSELLRDAVVGGRLEVVGRG